MVAGGVEVKVPTKVLDQSGARMGFAEFQGFFPGSEGCFRDLRFSWALELGRF